MDTYEKHRDLYLDDTDNIDPPGKSKRNIRRGHVERLKENRKHCWFWGGRKDPRRIGLLVNTPAPCSCWMCGNERKWWKHKSLDQISFEEISSIDIEELYEAP